MIKAVSKLADGKTLVVLGLSDGNIERLKLDDPIVFDLQEIGLDPQVIAIAWKRDDGMAGFPTGFKGIGLCFSSDAIEAMKTWPQVLETDGYRFTVFRGTDEQTMESGLREFIGQKTQVTHRGFSPSDIPPSVN